MTASKSTPRSGESVTDESSRQQNARRRFLETNLQLIRDRVAQVRSDLAEDPEEELIEELRETRAEIAAVEEMMSSTAASEPANTADRRWRCRFCGNVVVNEERPTQCYHCRRGESEMQLNDDRLFLVIDK